VRRRGTTSTRKRRSMAIGGVGSGGKFEEMGLSAQVVF
jgi:hypothetical protein